ncbi:MAG TPA: YcxB family protein [Acidobacteriaceae bacterium]|nr:YcxB family protein [Acidobacteriaceae bacterium]
MTIEYALTRTEIVRGYFRGLRTSPKFLSIILLYAAFLSIVVLATWGAFSRPLTIGHVIGDAVAFVATAAFFILLLSAWLFLRAKTSKRSITISPEGISTQIGKLQGQTPWRQIKIVSVTAQNVLIAQGNGNAYFIPNRAFSSPEKKAEFADKARNWMNAPEPV